MPNKSLQLTAQSAGALRAATELGRCTAVSCFGYRPAASGSESEQVAWLWPLRLSFGEKLSVNAIDQLSRLPVSRHSR